MIYKRPELQTVYVNRMQLEVNACLIYFLTFRYFSEKYEKKIHYANFPNLEKASISVSKIMFYVKFCE